MSKRTPSTSPQIEFSDSGVPSESVEGLPEDVVVVGGESQGVEGLPEGLVGEGGGEYHANYASPPPPHQKISHDDDVDDDDVDDDDSSAEIHRLNQKHPTRPFTPEDRDLIKQLVAEIGEGKWKDIADALNKITGRSSEQIRSCWRTMKKK
ncbi:hypothetical protein HDV00_009099 [Rhizophlyctis rosea]|nr:hypothetical protein HDV00_009099 [Rhizophlyctis rosea]